MHPDSKLRIIAIMGNKQCGFDPVGQNLGAKKPETAEKAVMVTGFINMILLGIVGLILVLFPVYFINIFIDDITVLTAGAECLRIISIGFVAYGFGMVHG